MAQETKELIARYKRAAAIVGPRPRSSQVEKSKEIPKKFIGTIKVRYSVVYEKDPHKTYLKDFELPYAGDHYPTAKDIDNVGEEELSTVTRVYYMKHASRDEHCPPEINVHEVGESPGTLKRTAKTQLPCASAERLRSLTQDAACAVLTC